MNTDTTGMETSSEETLLDFSNTELDDIDLGTIDTLPSFLQPPEGTFVLHMEKASVEKKVDKETKVVKKRIQHLYSIYKTIELADSSELIPPDGSLFTENFQLNAEGLKYWKKKATQILDVKSIDNSKLTDVLKELTDGKYYFNAKIVLKKTQNKADGKEYTNVQVRVVSPYKVGGEIDGEGSVVTELA